MNETNYTSLEFSKWLSEKGFEGESEYMWRDSPYYGYKLQLGKVDVNDNNDGKFIDYPAYDLIWDLCVKYVKEVFGEEIEYYNDYENIFNVPGASSKSSVGIGISVSINHTLQVFQLLQKGKKGNAELYIRNSCIL